MKEGLIVELLASGLAAAEGAQIVMEEWCPAGCFPSNNDNYCRILDWMKDVRHHFALEERISHETIKNIV